MPAKPQYYHELVSEVKVLAERIDNLRHEAGDLSKGTDRLQEGHNILKNSFEELRRQVTGIKESLMNQTKRVDEWDRRSWSFVALTIGALLSLASGLIVVLATR